MSVSTTSVDPSSVRPRRRSVQAPIIAHTSSTITTVVSRRLGRPGKPTGWKATTREPSTALAVGSARMRVCRACASYAAAGS
jgi:hypothetical protein